MTGDRAPGPTDASAGRVGTSVPTDHDAPVDGRRDARDAPVVSTPRLVDWQATGRRLARSTMAVALVTVTAWVVAAVARGSWSLASVPDWLGLGLLVLFVVEVVVVGGSAVRGLLRAGEHGERLSGPDVGLVPPRRRRRPNESE